jgi:putative acetyltransferase
VLGGPEYYSRFGFQKASDIGLQNEYGVNEEFMVIPLSEHRLPRGVVRYASEFAMFSV